MPNDSSGSGQDTDSDAFMDSLVRLFNKAAAIERDPVDTGDGALLYTSEIHLIDLAGRFPEESMSALASRLGITKGAVSQTVKKLEEKGFLERINPEGNNKTVFLRLTQSGQRAYRWHRAYHRFVNGRIARHIDSLTPEDRENLREVFLQLEKIFDDCPRARELVTQEIRKELS